MKQPDIERWLDDLEVPWTYLDHLALGDVDEKASLRNQARFEALDRETVDRYTDDMRRGDEFPAILVRRRGKGFAVVAPDGTVVDVYGRIGIGPGIGPHLWRDVHALRRFGWRIQQLADALLAAGATSPTTEPALPEGHIPGQLTIDDHLEAHA